MVDTLLDPEMHIIVDELAGYHSWLLGSYKENSDWDMLSVYPAMGWEGFAYPCFMKCFLRVSSRVLHTIASCPPGFM